MASVRKGSVALEEENIRLKAKVDRLEKMINSPAQAKTKKARRPIRSISSVILIVVGALILTVGNLLFWTGNTLVNTDRYMKAVGPLIEQPEVQQGVASYTTKQLFNNVDIETVITQALPPKGDFLAPALSSKVEESTQQSLQKLLSSEKFQDLWLKTQRNAHDRLVSAIKNYEGDGTINLQELYQGLSNGLKGTKLGFLANKPLPNKVGSITVVQADNLPLAHNIVTNISLYRWLAILLLILISASAVMLTRNKRRTLILMGLTYGAFMIVSLIAIRVFVGQAGQNADSAYTPAISGAAHVITNPLVIQTRTLLLLSLLLVAIAWISGPYRAAVATRQKIQYLSQGKAHQAIFSNGENSFTRFIGRHKRLLQWGSVVLLAIIMLFVQLNPAIVLWYIFGMIVTVLVFEVLAG